MLKATNTVVWVGLVGLLAEIRSSRTDGGKETHKVIPVERLGGEGCKCARCGGCGRLRANEVRRSGNYERHQEKEGRHGDKKKNGTDDLGGGKGQGVSRWLVNTIHGFYEPAKITRSRQRSPRKFKSLKVGDPIKCSAIARSSAEGGTVKIPTVLIA